jgi:hypothetical protein
MTMQILWWIDITLYCIEGRKEHVYNAIHERRGNSFVFSLYLQAEIEEPVDQPVGQFGVPIRRRVGVAVLSESAIPSKSKDGTRILTHQRRLRIRSSRWCLQGERSCLSHQRSHRQSRRQSKARHLEVPGNPTLTG